MNPKLALRVRLGFHFIFIAIVKERCVWGYVVVRGNVINHYSAHKYHELFYI
jgi:hypothetical protein